MDSRVWINKTINGKVEVLFDKLNPSPDEVADVLKKLGVVEGVGDEDDQGQDYAYMEYYDSDDDAIWVNGRDELAGVGVYQSSSQYINILRDAYHKVFP